MPPRNAKASREVHVRGKNVYAEVDPLRLPRAVGIAKSVQSPACKCPSAIWVTGFAIKGKGEYWGRAGKRRDWRGISKGWKVTDVVDDRWLHLVTISWRVDGGTGERQHGLFEPFISCHSHLNSKDVILRRRHRYREIRRHPCPEAVVYHLDRMRPVKQDVLSCRESSGYDRFSECR